MWPGGGCHVRSLTQRYPCARNGRIPKAHPSDLVLDTRMTTAAGSGYVWPATAMAKEMEDASVIPIIAGIIAAAGLVRQIGAAVAQQGNIDMIVRLVPAMHQVELVADPVRLANTRLVCKIAACALGMPWCSKASYGTCAWSLCVHAHTRTVRYKATFSLAQSTS